MKDDIENIDEIQILFDEIGKLMQDKKINNAVILLEDPEKKDKRMFFRGEFYEVAKLVAAASRTVKQKINEDLSDL